MYSVTKFTVSSRYSIMDLKNSWDFSFTLWSCAPQNIISPMQSSFRGTETVRMPGRNTILVPAYPGRPLQRGWGQDNPRAWGLQTIRRDHTRMALHLWCNCSHWFSPCHMSEYLVRVDVPFTWPLCSCPLRQMYLLWTKCNNLMPTRCSPPR